MKTNTETRAVNALPTQGDNVVAFDPMSLLGVPADASTDGLLELGVFAYNQSGMYLARAGECFRRLKDKLPKGEFEKAIESRNIHLRHAQRAMQLAEFISRLPEKDAGRMLKVPYTKALELAKADPEMLAELLDEGAIDGDQPLSVRDLRVRLEKAEKETARTRNQLDIVTNQKNMLARAGAALQAEEDLPHFALVVRQESLALTETMSFCLDNLEAITAEHLFTELKHPEAHRYQPVAAGTCYFALAGTLARLQALFQKIEDHYGDLANGMVTREHQLTAAELKRFVDAREQLITMHQTAADRRDDARENNKPGKRGAKRKGGV